MRLGFASVDWSGAYRDHLMQPAPGGACNVRMVLPQQALERHGHTTFIGTLISRKLGEGVHKLGVQLHSGEPVFDLDLLVIQRLMNADLIPHMKAHRAAGFCPLVNDLDDWFYGISTKNQAFAASHNKVNAEINIEHYRKVLAQSDAITCSTPYLRTRMTAQLNGRVPIYVVPNAIDMSIYTPKRGGDGKLRWPTIGWVGAIPWRSGDLESAGGVVGQFCNEHGLRFHHAGAIELDAENAEKRRVVEERIAACELNPVQVAAFNEQVAKVRSAGHVLGVERRTQQGMCPPWDYAATMFNEIDVGIVPLSSIPFNDAKSAIKGMEYAAAGVPFVAQDTLAYVELANEFGIGRVAHRPKDWLRELGRMLDPVWREEQREQNLTNLAQLDITARWSNWAMAYAKIARDVSRRPVR
jgi:hypothetical protein